MKEAEKLPSGAELDALVAERVMRWKDVRAMSKSDYWGKKQDRAGRWRKARVPDYSTDPLLAYEVEERMKELNLRERYEEELAKIVRTKGVPADWAIPEQRCKAALNAVKTRKRKADPSIRKRRTQ
jgi:Phage ABA sandwich domain